MNEYIIVSIVNKNGTEAYYNEILGGLLLDINKATRYSFDAAMALLGDDKLKDIFNVEIRKVMGSYSAYDRAMKGL